MHDYTAVLSPDPNAGGFSVTVPAMPGAITEGDTRDQALAAAAEVMSLWLEVAREHGDGPLEETPELIARQVASVIEDRDAEGWDRTIELVQVRPTALVS